MNHFRLTVLTAERPFYDGNCVSLVFPTVDGLYGILAGHTDFIGAVLPGVIKITEEHGKEIIAAVSEGIVKVENNEVLILADTAELPEEIDYNRAKAAAAEAQEKIIQRKSIQDYHLAQAKMSRAISRMKVKDYEAR